MTALAVTGAVVGVGSSVMTAVKASNDAKEFEAKKTQQEDIIKEYEDFIIKQSEAITACNQRLKQVDDKGIFKSDDEIGWMFKEILKIQEALNEFTLK